MFGGGREVASQGVECFGAVDAAQATRDFLVDFHDPGVSFRDVVVERDSEVGGEAQHVIGVEVETSEQVGGLGAFGVALFPGCRGRRVGGVPGDDDRLVCRSDALQIVTGERAGPLRLWR